MEYKFKKEIINPPKGSNVEPLIEYGVERESLNNDIKSLYHITSHGWTPEEAQMIIEKVNTLTGDDTYDYQVADSDLLIHIDADYAYFFDWRTNKETEDFFWSKIKFLEFMEEFKRFIEEDN